MMKDEFEIICLEILSKKDKIPYVALYKAFWILLNKYNAKDNQGKKKHLFYG